MRLPAVCLPRLFQVQGKAHVLVGGQGRAKSQKRAERSGVKAPVKKTSGFSGGDGGVEAPGARGMFWRLLAGARGGCLCNLFMATKICESTLHGRGVLERPFPAPPLNPHVSRTGFSTPERRRTTKGLPAVQLGRLSESSVFRGGLAVPSRSKSESVLQLLFHGPCLSGLGVVSLKVCIARMDTCNHICFEWLSCRGSLSRASRCCLPVGECVAAALPDWLGVYEHKHLSTLRAVASFGLQSDCALIPRHRLLLLHRVTSGMHMQLFGGSGSNLM
jgi:hypothetical protein